MQPNSVSSLTLIITSQNFSIAVHGVYVEGTGFETCYRPSLREFYRFFFLLPFLKIFSLKICHKWSTIWSTKKKLIFHYAYSAFFECVVHILCFERSVVTVFSRFQQAGAPNGSVPQNICSSEKKNYWLGDVEEIICPCKESVAGKKIIQGVWGDFMCRIAAMGYLS